jgi:hypothetical protein
MFGITNKLRIYLALYPNERKGDEPISFKPAILLVPRAPLLLRLAPAALSQLTSTLYYVAGTVTPETTVWTPEIEQVKPYAYDLAGLILLGKLPNYFNKDDVDAYLSEVPIVQNNPHWNNLNWVFEAIQVFSHSPSPMALTPVMYLDDSTPFYFPQVSCPEERP